MTMLLGAPPRRNPKPGPGFIPHLIGPAGSMAAPPASYWDLTTDRLLKTFADARAPDWRTGPPPELVRFVKRMTYADH